MLVQAHAASGVSMQVGQVGFHKQGEVRKVKSVEKRSDMLKKINKTQVEAYPDLEEQRKEYDRRIAKESKRLAQVRSHLFKTTNHCVMQGRLCGLPVGLKL